MRMLLSLPTTVPVTKAIQLRKVGSSAWIHRTFRQLHNFGWQQRYGAFSVRVSRLPETIHIQNQVEHHRTRTFQQEYPAFPQTGMISTTNICGTDNDFDRPSGTEPLSPSRPRHFVPGYYHPVPPGPISLSLRDKSHSPIEAHRKYL